MKFSALELHLLLVELVFDNIWASSFVILKLVVISLFLIVNLIHACRNALSNIVSMIKESLVWFFTLLIWSLHDIFDVIIVIHLNLFIALRSAFLFDRFLLLLRIISTFKQNGFYFIDLFLICGVCISKGVHLFQIKINYNIKHIYLSMKKYNRTPVYNI